MGIFDGIVGKGLGARQGKTGEGFQLDTSARP